MMLIRAVCLIVATILVYNHAPLLGLWIPILLFGMVAIPWLAVILANDRPPKEQYRLRHHKQTEDPRALTSSEQSPREPKTIDVDEPE